jgi:hypothetical protein
MLQDTLFEEWFFLTHESWLVSRIKAPFQAIVNAGEVGVELVNPVVRKTLKKDASHVVRSADRVRTPHSASGLHGRTGSGGSALPDRSGPRGVSGCWWLPPARSAEKRLGDCENRLVPPLTARG